MWNNNISKMRNIIGWVVAAALAVLFVNSGIAKLMHPENMAQMKLADWGTIIALGEIVSALLFLVPFTNKIGAFLLSSYMGGAIIIHMTGAYGIMFPSLILITIWVVAYVRNPELCNISLNKRNV